MFRIANIEYVFLLLGVAAVAGLFYWFKKRQKQEWKNILSIKGSDHFLHGSPSMLNWRTLIIVSVVLICSVFALMNPMVSKGNQEVTIESSDVMIALDISRSMLASDLKPNRLDRAKKLAKKIVKRLDGNRVGLILFAGDAYLFMPLTSDIQAALSFIETASTEKAPNQGTAISEAIQLSLRSLDNERDAGKSIIILTDGEDHEKELDAALSKANKENVYVFTIAVGTEKGGFVPGNRRDQYLYDENRKPVVSIVNTDLLEEIASKTNASSFNISKEKNIEKAIEKQIAQMEKQVSEVMKNSNFDSIYQWFVIPFFALLLLEMFGRFIPFDRFKKV